MKYFAVFLVVFSFGLFAYLVGRHNPIPVNPPNIRKCALRYELNDAKGGRTYVYCLNPVDESTGLAIGFNELDVDRIECIHGGPESGPICDKVLNRSRAPDITLNASPDGQ